MSRAPARTRLTAPPGFSIAAGPPLGASATGKRALAARWAALLVLGVLALLGAACGVDRAPDGASGITVAAASDLRPAFEELGEELTASTGTEVTFSFGSSGLLREQVLDGAPFDLFAAADDEFVDDVVASGRSVDGTRAEYALGRIALWAPAGEELPNAVDALADPLYDRIAVANPAHAPYGRAAVEALRSADVLGDVESRLVYGENVSDTFQIVRSGNADVGIVAVSLAVAAGGEHVLVPAEMHGPLRQTLVVTRSGPAGDAAAAFAELVTGSTGREILDRHGFDPPAGTETP